MLERFAPSVRIRGGRLVAAMLRKAGLKRPSPSEGWATSKALRPPIRGVVVVSRQISPEAIWNDGPCVSEYRGKSFASHRPGERVELRIVPALPNVPLVLKFRMIHTIGDLSGTGWQFYLRVGNNPSQSALNSMATQAAARWITNIAPLTSGPTTLKNITIQDLSSPSAFIGNWSGTTSGTRGTTELPASTCALVNMLIGRRYRGGKPRTYLPGAGIETDLADPQHWTTAFTTAVKTGYDAWVAGVLSDANSILTGPFSHVNVSYFAGHTWKQDQNDNWHRIPTPRATPVVDVITATAVNARLASQRKRLR